VPKSWAVTELLGCLWLFTACVNAYYHSAVFIRQHRRDASSMPFVGGLFAVGAFATCPWRSPLKWVALVAALILDRGSLRLLTLLVMSLAFPHRLQEINKRREDRVQRILRGG